MTDAPQVSAAGWLPVYEDDIPLGWPSREAFLSWLDERDRTVRSTAVREERARAATEAEKWLDDRGSEYAKTVDRLWPRLRYALRPRTRRGRTVTPVTGGSAKSTTPPTKPNDRSRRD